MLAGLTGNPSSSFSSLTPSSRNVSGGSGYTAHNEAIRQYQQAQNAAALVPPPPAAKQHQQQQQQQQQLQAKGVSSRALGSPFNEPGVTSIETGNVGSANATGKTIKTLAPATAADVNAKSNKDKRDSGIVTIAQAPQSTSRKPKVASAAGLGLSSSVPASQGRQPFPIKAITSGNSSSATLPNPSTHNYRAASHGATTATGNSNGNGTGTTSKRVPAVAPAHPAGRSRKVSSASDTNVKKDDLLERLAAALKYVYCNTVLEYCMQVIKICS